MQHAKDRMDTWVAQQFEQDDETGVASSEAPAKSGCKDVSMEGPAVFVQDEAVASPLAAAPSPARAGRVRLSTPERLPTTKHGHDVEMVLILSGAGWMIRWMMEMPLSQLIVHYSNGMTAPLSPIRAMILVRRWATRELHKGRRMGMSIWMLSLSCYQMRIARSLLQLCGEWMSQSFTRRSG